MYNEVNQHTNKNGLPAAIDAPQWARLSRVTNSEIRCEWGPKRQTSSATSGPRVEGARGALDGTPCAIVRWVATHPRRHGVLRTIFSAVLSQGARAMRVSTGTTAGGGAKSGATRSASGRRARKEGPTSMGSLAKGSRRTGPRLGLGRSRTTGPCGRARGGALASGVFRRVRLVRGRSA